jgi:hypothetical protein
MDGDLLDGIRYCGRVFEADEIERIRGLIASRPPKNRAELSRLVCEALGWYKPDGRPKQMSCRVAMLRMERDGVIALPPAQRRNGNGVQRRRVSPRSDARAPLFVPRDGLGSVSLRPVETSAESSLWNELIERYHYLGYKPLAGAQMRYLAFWGRELLGVMGFGAAAWSLGPRDRFIGWSSEDRKRKLHLVVQNARFLILPWVGSPNLASRMLGLVARRLPADWKARYRYRPVLLETFVEVERFRGTCYRAANWIHLGRTQGRGKLDRRHQRPLPLKEIFVYPLDRQFRKALCTAPELPQG